MYHRSLLVGFEPEITVQPIYIAGAHCTCLLLKLAAYHYYASFEYGMNWQSTLQTLPAQANCVAGNKSD
jgi:hypothetical protein